MTYRYDVYRKDHQIVFEEATTRYSLALHGSAITLLVISETPCLVGFNGGSKDRNARYATAPEDGGADPLRKQLQRPS